MSITITIEGNHPTDVLAQLQQLAAGLANQQLPAPAAEEYKGLKHSTENNNPVNEPEVNLGGAILGNVGWKNKAEEPKKLSRGEHKIEADKMIAAGKIDDVIFPLLSKNQQERVEAALNAQEAKTVENFEDVEPLDLPVTDKAPSPTQTSVGATSGAPAQPQAPAPKAPTEDKKDVGGLFDDEDEVEDALEINIDDLRALITKKCKDKNGKDIPEMYSAVRAEIKNVVPKDKEPKVSEVPVEKYAELYDAINSLGA